MNVRLSVFESQVPLLDSFVHLLMEEAKVGLSRLARLVQEHLQTSVIRY